MKLKRIDAVCIFDFEIDLDGSQARRLAASIASRFDPDKGLIVPRALSRISKSFDWIFYRSRWNLQDGPPTATRTPALPGFVRVGLETPEKTARLAGQPMGAVVSLCAELGIGSFIYWNTFDGDFDPFAVKGSLSLSLPEEYLNQLPDLVPHMTDLERLYPVISLMTESQDVVGFCQENAEELGRLFTGNMGHEPADVLKLFIAKNISGRDYEQFFVRWTDSLAVYRSLDDDELYELSLFRLVQVYEAAILSRRALQTYTSGNHSLGSRYRIWPRFIGIEERRDRLLSTTSLLVNGLPVQSDEARSLIENVSAAFHIDNSAEAAKQSFSFLEGRFQFAKATFLGGLALLAFVISNAEKFKPIVNHMLAHLTR